MNDHNGVNELTEETSESESGEMTHQLELSTEEKRWSKRRRQHRYRWPI